MLDTIGIKICDTTLRDGEQMPGVVFSPKQKIELAQKISGFGADIIELMPCISKSEAQVTKAIANLGLKAEITASTMLKKQHIDLAVSCNVDSVTLFAPVSDLHLEAKLKITREENTRNALEAIDYAKSHGLKINFAGEDSTRADMGYLSEFINTISPYIEYFLVCDTVGCHTPERSYLFFKNICAKTSCTIGLHGHNDFGMATANTISGLAAGAGVFSGTFTGIGERSGNVSIEEVCSALKFLYNMDLGINYSEMTEICRLVEAYSGISVQPHKPIVGTNSFSHESGIHVNGVLKNPNTYEPFDPKLVGQERRIILGKHSGKSSIKYEFGSDVSEGMVAFILDIVKSASEKSENEGRSISVQEALGLDKIKRGAE